MNQDNSQIGWLQLSPTLYCHIVPLADVIDVDRYAGIGAWRMEGRTMKKTVTKVKAWQSITKEET